MRKTLLYRLLKIGRIPREILSELEGEGIIVSDEGIGGWCVTGNLRAPGKRQIGRREGFSGWLAVTRKRIAFYTYRRRQIDIAVDDPKVRSLFAQVTGPGRLTVSVDSSEFRDGWQGVIEFRLQTERAEVFHRALIGAGARDGVAHEGGRPPV